MNFDYSVLNNITKIKEKYYKFIKDKPEHDLGYYYLKCGKMYNYIYDFKKEYNSQLYKRKKSASILSCPNYLTLNIIYIFKFYDDLSKIYERYIINNNCKQIIVKYDNIYNNINNNLWKFGLDSCIAEQNYNDIEFNSSYILNIIRNIKEITEDYIKKLNNEDKNGDLSSFITEIINIYKNQLLEIVDKADNINCIIVSNKKYTIDGYPYM
jgi:hypothetical protein